MPKEEDSILHFIIFNTHLIVDFIAKVLNLTCLAFFSKSVCWRKCKLNLKALLPCSANNGTSASCYSTTDLKRKQFRRLITLL